MAETSPTRPSESPFASALREAIEQRGLGLGRLVARLEEAGTPLSGATLSYWQSGRSRPGRKASLEALAVLEEILEVEPGQLAGQLGPPAVRGRHQEPPTWEALWEEVPEVVDAFGRMDTSDEDHLTRVSYHDRVFVGPDRTERGVWTRQVMRAERDGIDRFVIMHGIDDPACPVSQVQALERCTVGKMSADPGTGIVAVEMLLPRPLRRGELISVTYECVQQPPYPPAYRYERRRRSPNREYLLEVVFDPEEQPVRCETYVEPVDGEVCVAPLEPDPEHGLLFVELDGRPGVVGARWEWSGERRSPG